MSFNAITYYVFYKSLSQIMAHYSHVIYACYQNMPQNLFASCSFATNNFAERLYTSQRTTRGIYAINALFFRCTLMILHLLCMRRNVNRKVYNAGKCMRYSDTQCKHGPPPPRVIRRVNVTL